MKLEETQGNNVAIDKKYTGRVVLSQVIPSLLHYHEEITLDPPLTFTS